MQYYTMTTDAGDSAIAKAIQSGSMVTFAKMSVGDGNGTYYEPAKTQTALRNEVWSGTPTVQLDQSKSKRVTATIAIPASAGPFVVREAGLFDANGVLLVVAKVPLMEKVSPESGASDDLNMRIYVEVSDASAVTVIVDQSQINATKKDVDDAKAEMQAEVDAISGQLDPAIDARIAAKTDVSGGIAGYDTANAHYADTAAHITANERTSWNAKPDKSTMAAATIPASGWTGDAAPYSQAVSVDGVTDTSVNEILPDSDITAEQLESLQGANIQDGGQAAGSITLLAYGDKPTIDLPVRIIVRGDM
ncbi:MAG: phage tail protein [Oscillospiraceae bacterium]|jgi:phage-related tail fiber protein|nr:phage tail protein [Oscillospiraceae bacterium]